MRRGLVVLLLVASALLVLSARGPQARAQRPEDRVETPGPEAEKASIWMKQKLDASQKILEGLASADYELVAERAQGMSFLGYLEAWSRADVPGYKEQMALFGYANRELIRAARAKNLDGATLAYTQLTISCVQCHKIVRREQSK